MKLKFNLLSWLCLGVAANLGIAQGSPIRTTNPSQSDHTAGPPRPVLTLFSTAQSARPIPFRGTLNKLDPEAGTIQVGKRIFHITPETKLRLGDQPVKLSEIKVGLKVGGAYVKEGEGKLVAVTVRFRSNKPPQENEEQKNPSLFPDEGASR